MQTTLLGLAIALIIALIAALVGPYFIDWNQFRPQFEAEASRVIGAPVHVGGALDARLLPAPSLRLRSVVVGGANDLGKVRADKLDVEFSLGELMRGEWRATELTINGMALDLGLDPQGRIDWPASSGTFNLGSLAIDRLNLTGRVALHDAASRSTLELNDIAFSGDVRSLAGSVRGDGNFTLGGERYPFRVSSGPTPDGNGTRVHLNVDPGARAVAADLEGVLGFDARAPRFDGAVTLATPTGSKSDAKTGVEPSQIPWRISAKLKADPTGATLEQIEASYGAEERALKLLGIGDIRFGAQPLLHAVLSARQLDADRFVTKDNDKTAEPIRLLAGLRALVAEIPQVPIPTQIEFSAEQIMLGGRPLQNIAGELHAEARNASGTDSKADLKSWTVDRLNFRAPGATLVSLSSSPGSANALNGSSGTFREALDVQSSDPDALVAWLQGRSDNSFRTQKPLHLRGDISVAADHIAIDAMKAEIDGGTVEGRAAFSSQSAGGGSRFNAELKADRLDLDAATAFARSLAGPQGEWPDEATISLDIGRAISAGQELHPLMAKFGYGPKSISLDQLQIGDPSNVMLEGTGSFDRANVTGKLTLSSTAASMSQITAAIKPLAPALASRLDAMGNAGPAHLKLALDLDKDTGHADRASARAVLDLSAPQLAGTVTITAKPAVAALRAMELDKIEQSEFGIESKLSSPQGASLLALLGLDHVIAAGDGAVQFQGSVTGAWHAPLRLKAKLNGNALAAEAQGTAESWTQDAKASVNLSVYRVNLTPLFDLKPSDTLVQNVSLSSRVSLAGSKLTFDDLDGALAGSRLRGHVAVTLGDEKNVEGEVGLDTLDLAPAFGLAIGSEGRDAADPLGAGLLKGWHGHIAFQALRGALPGGGELRPVSGTIKSDGQSLTFDAIKGKIGGGDATANIDARPGANGIALSARIQLNGVDGAALHYRGLAMPAGRASLQAALATQGRSASALMSAMSGNGTVTLDSATIAGLDPRVFDVAVRASDGGQVTDDSRLRQIVDPVLSSGMLSVRSAQFPFTIRDGRLRVEATTLDTQGARAVISGGYDIPADQADIRATLAPTAASFATGRPEIQLFAAGTPDKLDRTVDVSALSSWLAVRTIDRETRRLDAIERGEAPPALPASVPPALALPPAANPQDQSPSEVQTPGRDQHRIPLKPRVSAPHPPLAAPNPTPPVVSQQVAPLPPPIEIRPAPGAARPPKPRPPLTLTPPVAVPQ
ncbi:AsmA family protein [Bradyrhizobium canariense]|uniref:Large subunit ribosomal protein L24 n=1 Tax=Bradyrhizobium canariense TaxID=255045 RepID=A0A1H1VQP8_9BRAD|nr:AsmA-like C-terminal region-containing protein [Bradyrhizobium canariense]SDS87217.1 large subunit ribosomal protein L24 [Bradyrhizobium canariense]